MPKRIVRITIKLSRYQQEKLLGEEYRANGIPGETFTEFKKRKKKESAEMLSNTEQNQNHEETTSATQRLEFELSSRFIQEEDEEEKA